MQILGLLSAICVAPIKHLVYLPIFDIFVIFPISCEITVILRWKLKQRVCNFLRGGGGANKVYFGWCANWQIKLSKYIFFYIRGVTTLKFTCNIENLSVNPLIPSSINMHLLHTVLHIFLMVLMERICSKISTFHLWSSFHSFSWPVCLNRQCYCWEKLYVGHYWGF